MVLYYTDTLLWLAIATLRALVSGFLLCILQSPYLVSQWFLQTLGWQLYCEHVVTRSASICRVHLAIVESFVCFLYLRAGIQSTVCLIEQRYPLNLTCQSVKCHVKYNNDTYIDIVLLYGTGIDCKRFLSISFCFLSNSFGKSRRSRLTWSSSSCNVIFALFSLSNKSLSFFNLSILI